MPTRVCWTQASLALLLALAGCGRPPSGPPSTETSSRRFATLAEKVAFLEKYFPVRTYVTLEYQVDYYNHSGGWVPGPSDWDIRIFAQVPPEELALWTEGLDAAEPPRDIGWAAEIAPEIADPAAFDWYRNNRETLGVDADKSLVLYRDLAN